MIYKTYIKRALDIILSLTALIILLPIMLITGVLVKIKLGSPVLFTQKRAGKDHKTFKMFKFRSMTDEKDSEGNLLPDDKRLPNFGKLLRSTSLDELPSLINILKGDMSIVGPRPLLTEYVPLYNEKQKQRHNVRPGLTGLAQVNGRNTITWERRFEYDLEYINDITFMNDLEIIFKTIKKVFIREGISSETSTTMEPFKGSK